MRENANLHMERMSSLESCHQLIQSTSQRPVPLSMINSIALMGKDACLDTMTDLLKKFSNTNTTWWFHKFLIATKGPFIQAIWYLRKMSLRDLKFFKKSPVQVIKEIIASFNSNKHIITNNTNKSGIKAN